MGFMAGPDKPPTLLLSIGIAVSVSIAIALTVFITVSASAPALTAASAISVMLVTFGDNLTNTGFLTAVLTLLTTFFKISGVCPISDPVSLTCGHETLSSTASAPASTAFLVTVAYSSSENP